MINLHNLPKTTQRHKKRLGRGYGGGKGAKSSRGTKRHQKAREKIKIWFEGGQNPYSTRFPLLRGKSKNKSKQKKPTVVTLSQLSSLPKGSVVDTHLLVKYNIVPRRKIQAGAKIVAAGILSKELIVKVPTSKSAREKIEEAGGRINTED